ncbi:MAG: hypothetical protein ACREND_02180 [Gemmatimonadaceae bacterium]
MISMMLTVRQFAAAVGADKKWVENAARTLRRRFARTESTARWLGAVRQISQALDTSLDRAADVATRALDRVPNPPPSAIATNRTAVAWVTFDVERYHTRFGVALATALLDGPRQVGPRPPPFPRGARTRLSILVGAAACGVDVRRVRAVAWASPAHRVAALGEGIGTLLHDLARVGVPHVVIGDVAAVARGASCTNALLEVCCRGKIAVSLLEDWKARPRGVSCDYPFIVDERTVSESPVLALDTRFGGIVIRRVADAEFHALIEQSDVLELGGIETRVLRIRELVEALRASRRRLAAAAIPELEAAAVVLNRVD